MKRPAGIPDNYVLVGKDQWAHPSRALGAIRTPEPKRDPVPALDQGKKARRSREKSMVVVVTLVRFGYKLCDGDNLQACFKGMRDAIAQSFAIDDNDPGIWFQYAQCLTTGDPGTIVLLERRVRK